MAKGDVLVRMKADVSNYDANMAKARKELDNFKNANLSFGGVMNQSSKMLTGIASKFVGLTGVIGAASGAIKVAKDAFLSSEGGIDEWGRTVEGAKGAYDVFLDTLRNGNWSNFFSNLNDAISGARELYNALDRLGSIKSNNQAAIAIVQQQIAQLRLMKQQGQNVDDQLKQATANLARLQKQSVDAGKKAGTMTAAQTIGNEIRSIKGAPQISDKTIQAVVGGIMYKGQAEFDKYARNLKALEALGTVSTSSATVSQSGYTTYTQSTTFDINKLTKEQQRQYVIAKAVTNKETDIQKGITIYAQAVNESAQSARQEFKYNRWSGAGSGGGRSGGSGKSGGGSTPAPERELTIQQQISDLEKEAYTATAERRIEIGQTIQALDKELERQKEIRDEIHGVVKESQTETGISGMSSNAIGAYRNMISDMMGNMDIGGSGYTEAMQNLIDVDTLSNILQEAVEDGLNLSATGIDVEGLWDSILGGENIPDDVWQDLQDKINEQLADMGIDPINIDFKTGNVQKQAKKMAGDWKDAASAIEKVGSAMSSIEDPAAKVVGTVAQAIATIALGYAEATTQAASMGPWAWVAFAATGLATMLSTISSIHSATGYANGGIIPGNSYSGDNQLAMVNAGEVILNRSQQSNLASQLQGSGLGNLQLSATVSGENLRLVLNNNSRRRGRGEYVTTNFR